MATCVIGEQVRDVEMGIGKSLLVEFYQLAHSFVPFHLVGAHGISVGPVGRKNTLYQFVVAVFIPSFFKPEPDGFLIFTGRTYFPCGRTLYKKQKDEGETEQ
ncbi:MAG: hypothetical protein IPJ82_12685 [Lewinellaceae bacterium]|nr:hypothetical protein [Lewinellaceae bacterium]